MMTKNLPRMLDHHITEDNHLRKRSKQIEEELVIFSFSLVKLT